MLDDNNANISDVQLNVDLSFQTVRAGLNLRFRAEPWLLSRSTRLRQAPLLF